jgi:hypothetical protein
MSTLPPPPPPGAGGPPPPGPPPPPSPWTTPTGVGQPQPAPGLATAALVLGIVGLFFFWTAIVPVLAVVFGLIAWQRAKRAPGHGDNRGRALAGWVLGAVGTAFFALFVVAAVVGWIGDDERVSLDDLHTGQCIDIDDGEDVLTTAPVIDCDRPHEGEVYATGDIAGSDDDYPGDEGVQRRAEDLCTREDFEDYVGQSIQDTDLSVLVIRPSEASWEGGDRHVLCVIVPDAGGTLSRSVAGLGD